MSKVALVDDRDFDSLNRFKWYAWKLPPDRWYAARNCPRIGGKQQHVSMHRFLLGARKGEAVDHVNGDGLDNRRVNLRLASQAQNLANARKKRTWNGHPTSSRFKGVMWHRAAGKWKAEIRVGGRSRYLGLFADEVEAAEAYNRAALQIFGEYARLNIYRKPVTAK